MKFIIGIRYVDNFFNENLTRWKVFISKPLWTLSFSSHKLTNLLCQFIIWHWEEVCFRFWHVVENILVKLWHDLKSWKAKIGVLHFSLTKISLLGFFQFKIWHIVKSFCWIFDTKKNLLIKIWYVDNFLFSYLNRCKFFAAKYETM